VSGVWDSTTFIWDGAQLLAELNGTATRRISEYAYYPGIDRPLALLTGDTLVTQRRFFIQDGLGNVIGVLRDTLIDQKITYDPWGRQQQVTGTLADTNRLRWKGLLWDGVASAYYMRNRWYDPQTGRFMSEDPLGQASGANAYAFGMGDPVNYRDPAGLEVIPGDFITCSEMNGQDYTILYIVRYPNGRADTTRTDDEYSCADYRAAMLASWRALGVSVGGRFGSSAQQAGQRGPSIVFPPIARAPFLGCPVAVHGSFHQSVRMRRGEEALQVASVTVDVYQITIGIDERRQWRAVYAGTIRAVTPGDWWSGQVRGIANCATGMAVFHRVEPAT
jgi:RHS repeat-associated protein